MRAPVVVVWDGMALIGAFTKRLLAFDPEHVSRQIAHRDPDLLVFMFGGNDMIRERSDLRTSMEPYEEEYREVLRRGCERARPKPRAWCCRPSTTASGRGADRHPSGGATDDRSAAPGGESRRLRLLRYICCNGGERARWAAGTSGPQAGSGDLAHPTSHGHKVLGQLIYAALMRAYADFRREKAGDELPAGKG